MVKKRVKSRESRVESLVIQFVGKKIVFDKATGKKKSIYRDAPVLRINGARRIELPSDEEQKAGFSHPDALFLLSAYPKDFKRKKGRGV